MSSQVTRKIDGQEAAGRSRHLRAVNYLAGAQIYLRDNVLLREPLRPEHIKDRLLGHWGTCPGINLVYTHLNRLILAHDLNVMLVTGPGHGAPANLANLYLEGSLRDFYPELTHNHAGLHEFVRRFTTWRRARSGGRSTTAFPTSRRASSIPFSTERRGFYAFICRRTPIACSARWITSCAGWVTSIWSSPTSRPCPSG